MPPESVDQSLYEEIFLSSPASILVHDSKTGTIVASNPAGADVLDVDRSTVEGMSLADVSPDSGAFTAARARTAIEDAATHGVATLGWRIDAGEDVRSVEITFKDSNGPSDRVFAFIEDVTRFRNREAQLRTHRLQRSTVFDSPQLFVGLLDTDGMLLEANETALEFADLERDEVVGEYFPSTPWWQEEATDREQLAEAITEAKDGAETTFFATYRNSEGERAEARVLVRPVYDEARDEVVNIIVEGMDVTEQVRREQQLRDRNEELNTLLDNVPVVLFKLDPEGVFQRSTGRGLQSLGLEPGELVGASIHDAFGDYGSVTDSVERALDGEEIRSTVEIEGTVYETWYRPVFEGDEVREIIGIARDVTELKRREDRFRKLSQATADLFTAETVDGVAETILDITVDIIGQDMAAYRCYEERVLTPITATEGAMAFADVDTPTELPTMADGTDEMAAFKSGEQRVIHESQSHETIGLPDIPLGTMLCVPIGSHGLLTVGSSEEVDHSDIDQYLFRILEQTATAALDRVKRDAELAVHREELEQSNENLQQFAYVASHDLQEPLRMVSSYIDLLDSEYGDELDEEASEYMDFAVDGARRMQAMIDSLLQYARVQTRAQGFETVDPNPIVEETLDALQLQIEETDATVTTGSLPTIEADPDQIGQVFQNLIKNALTYTSASDVSPNISVTGSRSDGIVTFAVVDNGPGVPERAREDIFEIFERGGEHDSQGTGIGLAVCRRIVRRHDGEMWFEEADSGGAKFVFTIPTTQTEGLNDD